MSAAMPFAVQKRRVTETSKVIKATPGATGTNRSWIEPFEKHLKSNLYQFWNRLSWEKYWPSLGQAARRCNTSRRTEAWRAIVVSTGVLAAAGVVPAHALPLASTNGACQSISAAIGMTDDVKEIPRTQSTLTERFLCNTLFVTSDSLARLSSPQASADVLAQVPRDAAGFFDLDATVNFQESYHPKSRPPRPVDRLPIKVIDAKLNTDISSMWTQPRGFPLCPRTPLPRSRSLSLVRLPFLTRVDVLA